MRAHQLRLYVVRGTPNSLRAEQNLRSALTVIGAAATACDPEIIDVINNSSLAMSDGVIVTPTLIGRSGVWRQIILGDLSDATRLQLFLNTLLSI